MPYENIFCCECLCFILAKLKLSCLSGFSVNIFLFLQIKVCTSTISTACERTEEISEKLRNVSSKGGNQIVEDVQLTVDIIEKIAIHVDLSNIEKTPKVWKSQNFGKFYKLYICENYKSTFTFMLWSWF